jgi:uncharacterized protein (DUF433 family)
MQRLLGAAELRFLRLAHELEGDLTPSGRRRLYQAVRKLPAGAHRLVLGRLVVDFRRIDDDLARRLKRLEQVRKRVEKQDGPGDPVIRGTNASVHVIGALARGQTIAEILADYPSLRRAQVEAAIAYAKAYPKRGRPYPSRSLKRMMVDLAAHEVDTEGTGEASRRLGR